MNFYRNKIATDVFNISAILNFPARKNIFTSIVFVISLFLTTNIFAAAGDSISNTATINYIIGGVSGTGNASASFLEDRLINFSVSEDNGSAAVPVISDMTDAVMQFTVTNTGNGVQDFLLTAVNTAPNPFGLPADNFDPLTIQVFAESGATPGYQAVEDTAVFIDELIPNVPHVVYVVADLPTQVIDDVSAIALIAQIAEGGALGTEGLAINADDNGQHQSSRCFQ